MAPSSAGPGFAGAIFDVDGVLVDSPHERAWRESLRRRVPRVPGRPALPAGHQARRLGVARQGGAEALWDAGADLVVGSLDGVDVDALTERRLERQ
jgi:hypothetical protein